MDMDKQLAEMLNDLYKQLYGDIIYGTDPWQHVGLHQSIINKYRQPVVLGMEHGVTFQEPPKFEDEWDESWEAY